MSENKDIVDMYNSWCEKVKKDVEKMENEFNEVINNFDTYIDRYSIATDYSKLVEINQVFGEISVLIHVGREMFYNSGVDMIEYRNKFAEQVFKVINVSVDVINRILNREEPADSVYFYGEYRNLKKLVYEIVNKRVSH